MPPSATRSLVWSCSSVVFISFGQTGPQLCFAHGQCSHAVFLFALPWQWPWPSSRSSESSEMALHPVPNCRRFVTEWPGVGNNEHRKKEFIDEVILPKMDRPDCAIWSFTALRPLWISNVEREGLIMYLNHEKRRYTTLGLNLFYFQSNRTCGAYSRVRHRRRQRTRLGCEWWLVTSNSN